MVLSRATSGNNRLGGDDFDERIVNWMVEEFRKEHGVDLSKDRMATAVERGGGKGQD